MISEMTGYGKDYKMKVKKIIEKTEIKDIEINGLTLLSKEEYDKYKYLIPKVNSAWWLRLPNSIDSSIAGCVDSEGDADINFGVNFSMGVSPALCISNLESSGFEIGDRFEWSGLTWIIISSDYAQCTNIIFKSVFREDWEADDANDYEASDVKKRLDEWFKQKIKEKNEQPLVL